MNNLGFQELIKSKKLLTLNFVNQTHWENLQFLGSAFNGDVNDFWAFLDTEDNRVLYIKREYILTIAEQ